MITNIRTGDYDVIDNNIVYLFDQKSDLVLHFKSGKFEFDLRLAFKEESKDEQDLNIAVTKDEIRIECTNFDRNLGTGTTKPLEIATINSKKIYFHFWVYLMGNIEQNEVARKVEYTVLSER